jgi:hypothetical protein
MSEESLGDECITCGEGLPLNECQSSQRLCGHHCNCSWTQDCCHWCGKEWDGEEEVVT